MKKPVILLAAVFIALTGVLLWWFSDSQVVKRNTRALAESLTVPADANKSARAIKAQNLAALLAPGFTGTLETDHHTGTVRRDEAITGHHYLTMSSESSHATLTDIEITDLNATSATATADFSIMVTSKDGGSRSETGQAVLTWEKSGDDLWKLASASLRKSP